MDQENMDQEKLRIWILLKQYDSRERLSKLFYQHYYDLLKQ